MSLNAFLKKIADNMSLPDRDLAREGSQLADEKRKATTGKEGAYSYKAKGQANKGKYRVNITTEARELAEELGVDIPSSAYTKNRFRVAENAKKFNEDLAAAQEAKNQEEEVTTTENQDDPFTVDGATAPDPNDPDEGLAGTGLPGADDGSKDDDEDLTTDDVNTSDDGDISLDEGSLNEGGPFGGLLGDTGTSGNDGTGGPAGGLAGGTSGDGQSSNPNQLAANAADAVDLLNQGTEFSEVTNQTGVASGQTSAVSGVMNFGENVATSTGPSDTELAGLNFGGLRGNVLTGPGGLLSTDENLLGTGDPEDDFLFSRSLLG
tara:strand:- start:1743 stop:2705 length:963 start_codon:yes stop_codon:yes gene_type:complete